MPASRGPPARRHDAGLPDPAAGPRLHHRESRDEGTAKGHGESTRRDRQDQRRRRRRLEERNPDVILMLFWNNPASFPNEDKNYDELIYDD